MRKPFLWLFMLAVLFVIPSAGENTPEEEKTLKDIEWMMKSMAVYEDRFQMDDLFQEEWAGLKDRLERLKSRIGSEITGDNINTATQQLESLRLELDRFLKKREEMNLKIFSGLRFLVTGFQSLDHFLVPFLLNVRHSILSMLPPDLQVGVDVNCPEDEGNYRQAVLAETSASYYQPGSNNHSSHLAEAIRLFAEVAQSECLPENSSMKFYARFYIQQKKEKLEELAQKLNQGHLNPEEKQRLLSGVSAGEFSALGKLDPNWSASLNLDPEALKPSPQPGNMAKIPETTVIPEYSGKPSPDVIPEKPEPAKPVRIPELPPVSDIGPESVYMLTLDVWQSAWGTFENLDVLLAYLRKNRIKKINLNPGLPMGPKFYQEGYDKLKPLVSRFYQAGVEHIGFLYAELNYPIEYYARFLRQYPDLKIDTLVDDSEFIDMFSNRFEQNVRDVKKYGIRYSAFVTLETEGNSGVSDKTRFWVLDHVDYPILMSYFGCSLEEQISKLGKYLAHADRRGIRRRVGIAILLGSKKIGREVSCERLLNEHQMKTFLRDLHHWAQSNHPSYGGIVLETNLKMPRMDVNWQSGQ